MFSVQLDFNICSALARTPPGILCPNLEPSVHERHGPLKESSQEDHNSCQKAGISLLIYRLRELKLFSLERRMLWGDLIAPSSPERQWVFTWSDIDGTRKNGFNGLKLKEEGFLLDVKKKFSTVRVVKRWKRMARETMDAPSLEVFKARSDWSLRKLI